MTQRSWVQIRVVLQNRVLNIRLHGNTSAKNLTLRMLEEFGEVPKRRNSEGEMKGARATFRGQIFVITGGSVQASW